MNDFDSMPYLLAVGKVRSELVYLPSKADPHISQEVLRFYPALIETQRMPNKDDVLPLSKPIVGISGKVYKELAIPAGTFISISTLGYNLYVHPLGPLPQRMKSVSRIAGTRTCGAPTLMNSGRSDGSKWTESENLRLEFMVICV